MRKLFLLFALAFAITFAACNSNENNKKPMVSECCEVVVFNNITSVNVYEGSLCGFFTSKPYQIHDSFIIQFVNEDIGSVIYNKE